VRVADALRKTEHGALSQGLAEASRGPAVQVIPPLSLLSSLRGSTVLPSEVAAAISQRQEAAANLAARWLAAEAVERTALATTLGDALLAEDQARTDAYARLGDLSEADRLALLHDRITWLGIKIAPPADIISLVPSWEARRARLPSRCAAGSSMAMAASWRSGCVMRRRAIGCCDRPALVVWGCSQAMAA
jgi:hypothetical protein